MKTAISALALCSALLAGYSVAAPTYQYDYTYNGSQLTTNQSAAGNQLSAGQTVGLKMRTLGNDYWASPATTMLWAPIAMQDQGTRIGNLSWTFSLNGATVGSGSYTGQGSSFAHIGNFMNVPTAIHFDELSWVFTLTSSTVATNTLGGLYFAPSPFVNFGGAVPAYVVVPDPVAARIPEPGSLALLGLGLAAVALSRKAKRQA
ncbi:PEP-CTERM sorting domain-containing protein [Chitinivorax sp. PXF-14]|uniref:PEP-CTERM sorting domain-containing protein n=1 Tax=Chitinivorax sp. PXF-14 TaxID=3230488 RepID=UPI003466ABEE